MRSDSLATIGVVTNGTAKQRGLQHHRRRGDRHQRTRSRPRAATCRLRAPPDRSLRMRPNGHDTASCRSRRPSREITATTNVGTSKKSIPAPRLPSSVPAPAASAAAERPRRHRRSRVVVERAMAGTASRAAAPGNIAFGSPTSIALAEAAGERRRRELLAPARATSANLTFGAPVTLQQPTCRCSIVREALRPGIAGTVAFSGTIDSPTARALTVTTPAAVAFGGAVGKRAGHADSLTANGGGAIAVNGSTVITNDTRSTATRSRSAAPAAPCYSAATLLVRRLACADRDRASAHADREHAHARRQRRRSTRC